VLWFVLAETEGAVEVEETCDGGATPDCVTAVEAMDGAPVADGWLVAALRLDTLAVGTAAT
jgi:hypothetical protein